MAAAKNLLGKTRGKDKPYLIVRNASLPGWEWRVLKAYQSAGKEALNGYARWLCVVTSPMTGGLGDMGDTYVSEVLSPGFQVTHIDPELAEDITVRLIRSATAPRFF